MLLRLSATARNSALIGTAALSSTASSLQSARPNRVPPPAAMAKRPGSMPSFRPPPGTAPPATSPAFPSPADVSTQILACDSSPAVLRYFMRNRTTLDVVSSVLCLTQVGLTLLQGGNKRQAESISAIHSEAMTALRIDLLNHFSSSQPAASRVDPRVAVSAMHALARIVSILRDDRLFHAAALVAIPRIEALAPHPLAMLAHSLAKYRSPLLCAAGEKSRAATAGDASLAVRISDASVSGAVCASWPPYVPPGAVAAARATAVAGAALSRGGGGGGGQRDAAPLLSSFRSPWEPADLVMLAEAYSGSGDASPLLFSRVAASAAPLVPFMSSKHMVALVRAMAVGGRRSATSSDAVTRFLLIAGAEAALRMQRQAAAAMADAAASVAIAIAGRGAAPTSSSGSSADELLDVDSGTEAGTQPVWQRKLFQAFERAGLGGVPSEGGGRATGTGGGVSSAQPGHRYSLPQHDAAAAAAVDTQPQQRWQSSVESRMHPSDVSALMHSYAALNFRCPSMFDGAVALLLQPYQQSSSSGASNSSSSSSSSGGGGARRGGAIGIGGTATSVGGRGAVDSGTAAAAIQSPQPMIHSLSGSQLASVAWSLARLRHGDGDTAASHSLEETAGGIRSSAAASSGGGSLPHRTHELHFSGTSSNHTSASVIWPLLLARATELMRGDEQGVLRNLYSQVELALGEGVSSAAAAAVPADAAGTGGGAMSIVNSTVAGSVSVSVSHRDTHSADASAASSAAAAAAAVVMGSPAAERAALTPQSPPATAPVFAAATTAAVGASARPRQASATRQLLLRPHQIATLCWAATHASVRCRPLVHRALLRLGLRPADFSVPAIAQLVWAAAVQGVCTPPQQPQLSQQQQLWEADAPSPALLARCVLAGMEHVVEVAHQSSASDDALLQQLPVNAGDGASSSSDTVARFLLAAAAPTLGSVGAGDSSAQPAAVNTLSSSTALVRNNSASQLPSVSEGAAGRPARKLQTQLYSGFVGLLLDSCCVSAATGDLLAASILLKGSSSSSSGSSSTSIDGAFSPSSSRAGLNSSSSNSSSTTSSSASVSSAPTQSLESSSSYSYPLTGALPPPPATQQQQQQQQSVPALRFDLPRLLLSMRDVALQSSVSISNAHREVVAVLAQCGVGCVVEYAATGTARSPIAHAAAAAASAVALLPAYLLPAGLRVDVFIPPEEVQRLRGSDNTDDDAFSCSGIAIEVDGPHHYVEREAHSATKPSGGTRGSGSKLVPTLKTIAKRRWLAALGYRLVVVPYTAWGEAPSSQERAELLFDLGVPIPSRFVSYA